MYRYVIVIIFCCWMQGASSQNLPGFGANRVRINEADRSLLFEVEPVGNDIDVKTDFLYFWYSANRIHTTQGGYSGKLLNGAYAEFYPNKNIKEQGTFKNGLKNGIWKEWTEGGLLVQTITWKNGLKSGDFSKFDANGSLAQQGKYFKGQFDGYLYDHYGKDSVSVTYYKKGVLAKKPIPFIRKLFSHKSPKRDTVKTAGQ